MMKKGDVVTISDRYRSQPLSSGRLPRGCDWNENGIVVDTNPFYVFVYFKSAGVKCLKPEHLGVLVASNMP